MARLGRSFPVNWSLANRNRRPLNTPAGATLAVGLSVSATGTFTIGGNAALAAGFVMGNFSIPPAAGSMSAGLSLTAGGFISDNAALPLKTTLTAVPSVWLYTGTVPVTYLQYLGDDSEALDVVPGETLVAVGVASGYAYFLPVPPPDGNWAALGGGGAVGVLEEVAEESDPLAWDPPAALAHLPVPFEVIRRRIEAGQRKVTAG